MIGLKYKRMIEDILEMDTVPSGIRKIIEDILQNYEKYSDYCPKGGQIGLIQKSYAINVKGEDVRDVAKRYQLPDEYPGISLRYNDDGYYVHLEESKVGQAVVKEEGRKILSWLNKALAQMKEVITGVAAPALAPPWAAGASTDDDIPYFAETPATTRPAKKARPF